MLRSKLKSITKLLLIVGLFSCIIFPTISIAYDGGAPGDPNYVPPRYLMGPVGDGTIRPSGLPTTPGTDPTITANNPSGGIAIDGNLYAAAVNADGNPGNVTPPPTSTFTLGNAVYDMLFGFVVTFFGWLLSWGSFLLEIGITQFMLGFGDKYFGWNVGVAVEEVWKIIRDLFNLTFIFGLVYIGFKMILDANDSSARKMLVNLIGAALLVNFSLFIVKFVIDFSHITASMIANGLTQGGVGIGNAFINVLGLGTIFDISQGQIVNFQSGWALAYIFGTMIFLCIAAFVFAAGGILLIIRFVVLNIYLVFSPVMFLGWVFPSMSSHSSKYWDGFLKQAFFAPAYLLMLYLSLKVLETYKVKIGSVRYADVFASQGSGFSQGAAGSPSEVIPFFILAMTFMILSLVVAKNMGAVGASTAISFGKKLQSGTLGAISGAGGYMAYKRIDKMANSDNRLARSVGRGLTLVGARDGAQKAYKNSIQGHMAETRKQRTGELATRKSDSDAKNEIKKHVKTPGADLEQAVRGASTEQIMSVLKEYKPGTSEYNNIVDSLTHEQRKKILDSPDDKISASTKDKIGSRAGEKIQNDIDSGRNEISKLTPKQIDIMGRKWIKDNFDSLTNSQVEKLASDSTVLGESEKSSLKKDWGDQIEAKYTSSPGSFDFAKYMDNKTAKDVASLPAKVLVAPGAAPFLTEKVLRVIAESNMTIADRIAIENIMGNQGANTSGQDYLTNPKNTHKITNW